MTGPSSGPSHRIFVFPLIREMWLALLSAAREAEAFATDNETMATAFAACRTEEFREDVEWGPAVPIGAGREWCRPRPPNASPALFTYMRAYDRCAIGLRDLRAGVESAFVAVGNAADELNRWRNRPEGLTAESLARLVSDLKSCALTVAEARSVHRELAKRLRQVAQGIKDNADLLAGAAELPAPRCSEPEKLVDRNPVDVRDGDLVAAGANHKKPSAVGNEASTKSVLESSGMPPLARLVIDLWPPLQYASDEAVSTGRLVAEARVTTARFRASALKCFEGPISSPAEHAEKMAALESLRATLDAKDPWPPGAVERLLERDIQGGQALLPAVVERSRNIASFVADQVAPELRSRFPVTAWERSVALRKNLDELGLEASGLMGCLAYPSTTFDLTPFEVALGKVVEDIRWLRALLAEPTCRPGRTEAEGSVEVAAGSPPITSATPRRGAQPKTASASSTIEGDPGAMLTVSDLAERFGKKKEPLRKRLDRWRKKNLLNKRDWSEDSNATSRDARYLYRLGAVRQVIGRGRPTKRPANVRRKKNDT